MVQEQRPVNKQKRVPVMSHTRRRLQEAAAGVVLVGEEKSRCTQIAGEYHGQPDKEKSRATVYTSRHVGHDTQMAAHTQRTAHAFYPVHALEGRRERREEQWRRGMQLRAHTHTRGVGRPKGTRECARRSTRDGHGENQTPQMGEMKSSAKKKKWSPTRSPVKSQPHKPKKGLQGEDVPGKGGREEKAEKRAPATVNRFAACNRGGGERGKPVGVPRKTEHRVTDVGKETGRETRATHGDAQSRSHRPRG